MKRALNYLGYYTPPKNIGMTGIPDSEIFAALKRFQADEGLEPTGRIKPGDETEGLMFSKLGLIDPDTKYIWRTVGDAKVRKSHAELEGEVLTFGDSPDPGEEENCRCSAEIIPKKKKNCDPEREAYIKAIQAFNELDRQKAAIENELGELNAQEQQLLGEAGRVFALNIPGRAVPSKGAVGAIIGEVVEGIVDGQSNKILNRNSQELRRVRSRVQYIKGQLDLVIFKLNEAADNVLKRLNEWEECKRRLEG